MEIYWESTTPIEKDGKIHYEIYHSGMTIKCSSCDTMEVVEENIKKTLERLNSKRKKYGEYKDRR